jgi:xanthine dehydrogenase large subunit
MGQGLYTKIRQIVAGEFGLPLADVRLAATDTSRVSNTSATAASSGTDLNGKAAQAACQQIKARLAALMVELAGGGSADAVRFADGQVRLADFSLSFAELAMRAYRARVQL